MQKKIILGATALVIAAGLGFFVPQTSSTISMAAFAQSDEAEVDKSLVVEMTLGDENAPIEMIEYASFTCPHCAFFHENVFDPIKTNYIDTGKVRFISREVYADRFGLWAGMIARCDGDTDRYFGIIDLIFEKQREWIGNGDPSEITQNLRTLGKTAGLNDEQLDTCLKDENMARAMVAVFQENMERDDIQGTPTVFIDGEHYSNMSYEEFARIFDEKLAE